MIKNITFTHKGWFGICPVYFAAIESEAPIVEPRYWIFGFLMMASEIFFNISIWVMTFIDPAYEPMWPLRITGELKSPNGQIKAGA